MKNFLFILSFLLFFSCHEKTIDKKVESDAFNSRIDSLKKDCKALEITFQVPNSKIAQLAREYRIKDSIDYVFTFFENLNLDSTTLCTFQYWGDIYFYKDTLLRDYYLDMYFSTEEDCFIFQNWPCDGPETKKYIMTREGRLFLNKLQAEFNIPEIWNDRLNK